MLQQMMIKGQKAIHKLNPTDLNAADRMKFDPTLKLISEDLINHLTDVVHDSLGTATYLKIMRNIYVAFYEQQLSPTERVTMIWFVTINIYFVTVNSVYMCILRTSLFFLRAWRQICMKQNKTIKHCPTSNAYISLELSAHGLVKYMVRCRIANTPEQFVVQNMTSQPCETTFRELRSMTTVNHTSVNFTMMDVEQRFQKVQMKLLIAYRRKHEMTFPSLQKQEHKMRMMKTSHLPNDDEIRKAIETAEQNAKILLISLGIQESQLNFREIIDIRMSKPKSDFDFITINENQMHNNITEGESLLIDTYLYEVFTIYKIKKKLCNTFTLH
ncbi:uncharacterized protein LOC134285829 [Aedes albopictus]|uniref:Secreted protein n=1 Tax=Aedes albopictus TaxID=7160 RepID=A0ABM1ZS49_AEDAL